MFIVKNRKFFYTLSIVLIAFSLFSIWKYGFNLGIDFKGGSVLEVSYREVRPDMDSIKNKLNNIGIGSYTLSPSGEKNYTLKSRDLNPNEKIIVLSAFQVNPENVAKEERFSSIGPSVGDELRSKALIAITIVVICIVIFITIAFRKVSNPLPSWKYGLATIIALAHDVLIPTGVYVAWINFKGGEVDLLFVTALLSILGYSVHDTIVVFDRVRESLRNNNSNKSFEQTVGDSLMQTIGRSINTSLTTFIALFVLYLIGGETTQNFSFVLLVGIIVGTYSSIFVASPLLVTLEKFQKK